MTNSPVGIFHEFHSDHANPCTFLGVSGFHTRRMDDHVKQLLLLGREHYQKRELDKAEYLLRQVVA